MAGPTRLLPFPAMKGIVLAGGTATRLYPLTIVTNKHLLPIYDRPMIYYPIETLAGMGIREVMVIVGGKSVGDVVELLADGVRVRARPDLSLPARRARASPTPSGWPATSSATTRSAASSATTSCAGRPWPTSPTTFEAGPYGAGTLLYRVPDPERFGVAELDADGRVVGFEEKPEQPKSDLIPIGVYFLRPDAFDVIDAPRAVGPRRARDHRRPQPLHPRRPALQPGLRRPLDRRRDGAVAAARRRAGRRRTTRPAACRRRSAARSADDGRRDARVRPPARHRRCRVHRLVLRPRRARPPRRDADHRPRQADLRRATRPTSRRSATTRRWPPGSASSSGDIADPDGRRPARRRGRRGRQLRRRIARRPLDPRPGGVPARPGSSASTSCSRRAAWRRAGRASCRSRPTRSTARSTRATPTEDAPLAPRSPYAAAKAAGELLVRALRRDPRRRRGRDPRLEHVRPVPPSREAHPAVRHQRARRPAAAAVRRRPPAARVAVRRRPRRRRSTSCCATARPARPTTSPAATETDEPRGRRRSCSSSSASRGRWSCRSRTGPATTGATRWTARRLAALGWRPATVVRGRPGRDRRLVPGQRGVVAGGPVGRLGRLVRAPVRPPAGDRPGRRGHDRRRRRRDAGRLMRVAVTGAAGRLGSDLVAALADAPFTGPAGPIAWTRAAFDLDAPGDDRRAARPGPARGRRPCRRLDRRRRLRLDPELAMRRNGDGDRRPGRGLRRARDRPADRVSTNEVFDGTPGRRSPATSRPSRCRRATRTARPRPTAERRPRPPSPAGPGPASASPGRPGCSGRPGATSRAGSSTPPSARGRPASRSASVGDEWGTPDLHAPMSPRRSSSCWRTTRSAGIHHLVNGLFATRADWARYVVGAGRRGRRGRQRAGVDLAATVAGRRAGASSRRRRCRRASRSGLARRDGRLRAGAAPRGRDPGMSPARPPSALPGVRYGAIDRHADARGSFRELWRAARRSPAEAVRPGEPVELGGRRPARPAPPSPAGRPVDRRQRPRLRRARRRPPAARRIGSGARRRDPRVLAADEWVLIPTGVAHGFLALEPLELIYLVTNEYDGTDELGFAWDDPAVAVAWPALAGDAGRPARSCPSATARTRRWRDLVARLRTRRRLTRTPPLRPAPHRARTEGASGVGTIPRLSRRARPTRLTRSITAPRPARSPRCARPSPSSPSPSSPASASRVPSAAAALAATPKVVIIVGATHGATAGYRADADQAYAEAIKYTSNVVKVYSPNATWAKVKAAVAGRIDRHLHGPRQRLAEPVHVRPDSTRPRTASGSTPRPAPATTTTSTTASRTSRRSTSRRARSSSSTTCATRRATPSRATPSRPSRVARQRADNYAAGFLKAGASAVIADGHRGAGALPARPVHDPPDDRADVARTSPNANGHVVSFASVADARRDGLSRTR